MAKDDAYKAAMKSLDALLDKQKALKKSTDGLKDSWSSISSELFKIDGASFFKEVRKSPAELRKIAEEIENIKNNFNALGDEFTDVIKNASPEITGMAEMIQKELGDAFSNVSKISKESFTSNFAILNSKLSPALKNLIKNEEDLKEILSGRKVISEDLTKELRKQDEYKKLEIDYATDYQSKQKLVLERMGKITSSYKELNNLSESDLINLTEKIAKGPDWNDIVKSGTPEQREVLAIMSGQKEKLSDINDLMSQGIASEKALQKSTSEANKEFSLTKGLVEGITKQIKTGLITSLTEFDTILHDVQKNTSINMVDNSVAFASMTSEVARFGVSVEQAGKMMADMSGELRTTDFGVLATAAKDFAVIEGATGAAAGDITTIAGELMRMGESSGQVKDFMEGADQEARKFGVSSSKVLGGISRNIKKMREMGFVGGEKSLTKMAITAERLKMNMDETFDMAERARSIEGAMDMAAELQLAGGSFANINPMDLLSAARKGPAELQKILTKMGSDIGHFDKETGKMVFDPVDVDRLQMVSKTTGQSMESLQNMIATNASDIEKIKPFDSMLAGLNEADAELAKSGISQMMKMNKDGTVEFDVKSDMAKRMGVDSMEELQAMSAADLKTKMEADAKTLEEQNIANQDTKKSFDNFIKSLMGIMNVFQPILEVLGTVFQFLSEQISKLPQFGKFIVGGLMIAFTLFGTSVGAFITQGIGGFLKGVGGFTKSTFDFIKNITSGKGMEALSGLGKGIAGKFAPKAASAATDLAGGLAGTGGKVAGSVGDAASSAATAKIGSKIDMGGLLKFSAAMALIGAAVMMFGVGMNQMGGISALDMLAKGAITIGLLALAVWGISQIKIGLGNIIKFSLAMTLVGLAMIPFAFAAQMMTDIDWMSVLAGIGILTLVVFGLMGLGMLMAGPQIIFLLIGIGILIAVGAALLIAAAGLLLAANAFQALGAVDWNAFSGMGDALASVVPGMLGFSLAAMLFANPLTILGLMFMAGALGGLVAVMAPLAESLTLGADSLDRFANGLEKLSAAADSLSLEKLEKLKELSDAMASASSGGNAMAAMANVASASGGAGGGGDVRRIEVDVKLNGRELQNFIVKDTAIIK